MSNTSHLLNTYHVPVYIGKIFTWVISFNPYKKYMRKALSLSPILQMRKLSHREGEQLTLKVSVFIPSSAGNLFDSSVRVKNSLPQVSLA